MPSILFYAACLIRFVQFDDRMKHVMYLISCMAPLTNLNEPSEGEEHLEMKGGCLGQGMTLSTLWIV